MSSNNTNNSLAVSIVIPMYNTDKYIRQCLISVLSQKFVDFEVIVVDDCSKDNSVNEVEKLMPHFEGRLKLIRRNEQSGCAGIPRNDGIKAARGKYIVFLDSDDMLLPTTLRDYVEIAENTKADVLHTEKVLVFADDGREFKRDELVLAANENGDFVETITAESNDLTERIKRYHDKYFFWAPWGKCFRREFLMKNNIEFPAMRMSEDMIFCFKCLALAKNYIRIPNITYIYRERQSGSLMRSHSNAETEMNKWLKVIVEGINILDEFMDRQKFFNKHLDMRYLVIDFFMNQHFEFLQNLLNSLKSHEIEYLVYRYLSKNKVNSPSLTAYLFTNNSKDR